VHVWACTPLPNCERSISAFRSRGTSHQPCLMHAIHASHSRRTASLARTPALLAFSIAVCCVVLRKTKSFPRSPPWEIRLPTPPHAGPRCTLGRAATFVRPTPPRGLPVSLDSAVEIWEGTRRSLCSSTECPTVPHGLPRAPYGSIRTPAGTPRSPRGLKPNTPSTQIQIQPRPCIRSRPTQLTSRHPICPHTMPSCTPLYTPISSSYSY
jgi:hypothetical protein